MTPSFATDTRAEYGNFRTLRELFGIARSTAYILEKAGEIKFARVKRKGNVVAGQVLVNFDTVRAYLTRCQS